MEYLYVQAGTIYYIQQTVPGFAVFVIKGSRKIKKYLQQLEDYDKLTNGLYERGLLL